MACQSDTEEFTLVRAQEKEKQAWAEVPNILARIVPPKFPNTTFNILDYGAVSDTLQDSRTAILDAIVACQAAGGGRVVIRPGH